MDYDGLHYETLGNIRMQKFTYGWIVCIHLQNPGHSHTCNILQPSFRSSLRVPGPRLRHGCGQLRHGW